MQLVSAPGGISAHDASFHPILSLVLAILRLISDKRCFYKYVYIYLQCNWYLPQVAFQHNLSPFAHIHVAEIAYID